MELKHVSIQDIVPNRDNPRGIDIQTEDEQLPDLTDSIKDVGVMVPVVLTPQNNHYLLVDGERRYHAARKVGLKKLPAYIITGEGGGELEDEEILFRMFQIHHLRKQWGPVQQCHALEKIYRSIAKLPEFRHVEDPREQVTAVADRLAEMTRIDPRTALDRVKFLRWPADVKKSLYKDPEESGYWYICEIEDKIVIPALTNYPEYFDHVSVDEVRVELFQKLKTALARATEVRRVAPYFRAELSKTKDKKIVYRVLNRLRKNEEMTYEDAQHEFEEAFPNLLKKDPPTPRRLLTSLTTLEDELERFDVSEIPKATRRAKATERELLDAAGSLQNDLDRFVQQLEGATK